MPTTLQVIEWIQSGNGRLVVAAVLFVLMWAIKSLPWVRDKILTTPRRKQIAAWLLMMPPAVWMIVEGAPWAEVVAAAVGIILAANGINTYRPSKAKPPGPLEAAADKGK